MSHRLTLVGHSLEMPSTMCLRNQDAIRSRDDVPQGVGSSGPLVSVSADA